MVGNDQLVLSERGTARVACVLEKVEQARFAHQPFHECQVAFLVLGCQAALRMKRGIDQVVAPAEHQLALALPAHEDGIEDFAHGFVLEHAAVAVVRQERRPGLHDQDVTRHAAVGAGLFHCRDVAMEGPAAVVDGQQFQQRRLA
jgi:hypothetical protein